MARAQTRKPETGKIAQMRSNIRLAQAQAAGLIGAKKNARIAGRVSPELLAAAKKRAGVTSDTDVIEVALATLALEDDFGRKLVRAKGSVPKDLKFDL
jgi:hypothetical protein